MRCRHGSVANTRLKYSAIGDGNGRLRILRDSMKMHRPTARASRWLRVLAMTGLVAVGGQAAAEAHRFASSWRAEVEPLLMPAEVMALGERKVVEGSSGAFTVRIASAALVPKMVAWLTVVVGEGGDEAPPRLGAVFAVAAAGGAVEISLRVALERAGVGEYGVAPEDRQELADWLREHIDELDRGNIAVQSIDGLGESEQPSVIFRRRDG